MTQQNNPVHMQKQISFELYADFYTRQSIMEIQGVLFRHAKGISDYQTIYSDGTIGICKIAAGAGAINREDAAFIQLQPAGNGYRCIVSVIYKPSIFF